MVLRKLRKLFRQGSRVHMHPRKNRVKLIACQQQVHILRENITFHLKVSVPSYIQISEQDIEWER